MGCAQGRCATRLRYAPTFYLLDSKPLLRAAQERLPVTVPKPCQNATKGQQPCQNSEAAISISYGRWVRMPNWQQRGSVGRQKARRESGPCNLVIPLLIGLRGAPAFAAALTTIGKAEITPTSGLPHNRLHDAQVDPVHRFPFYAIRHGIRSEP